VSSLAFILLESTIRSQIRKELRETQKAYLAQIEN